MSEPTWELLGGGGVLGPAGIDYVGDWVAGTTYQPGQIVRYAGVDYIAVNPSIGQTPPLASPYPHAMVCLYDNELAADGAGWDVPNISSAFAHLRLVFYMRSAGASGVDYLALQFNGDTGANYDYQRHSSSGAAVTGTGNLAQTTIFGGYMPGANAAAGMFGISDILIPNYARTLGEKLVVTQNFYKEALTTAAMAMQNLGASWRNTAAINRIRAFLGSANFKAGSRLTIYGLLSQGQSPPVTTLSPGGIGTSFPVSPANGEVFTLVDSLTAPTYSWNFRYVASITDAYKWVFIGGSDVMLYASIGVWASIGASGTWGVLSPSLSFPTPRPGHYDVMTGAQAAGAAGGYIQIGLGHASGVQGVQLAATPPGSPGYHAYANASRVLSVPAGGYVAAWYWASATDAQFANRWLQVRPVRLS